MISGWSEMRDFINSKEIGHIFTRKELILLGHLKQLRSSTVDTIRNTLVRAGFFTWISRGKYQLKSRTTPDATLAEITALAFEGNLMYLEKVLSRKERESHAKEKI